MSLAQFIRTNDPRAAEIRRPFVIAEAGVNHEGSMELAKRLIEEAAEGGADAIKFQSYKADKIAARHSPSYWDLSKEPTTSQHALFQKYDKFWKEEFEALKIHCDGVGIEFLSTPFDVESATFLNDLMEVYKISSSDLTNHPFIEFMCDFGKPVLLSTGAANLDEVFAAVQRIEAKGNPLCLLHCILNYPTPDALANLGMILDLRQRFPGRTLGYSDHTLPGDMSVLETAVLLGAPVLEKHFTHDKSLPGNDHYHAMDKDDLRAFQRRMDVLFSRLGSFQKRALPEEDISRRNARRSLVLRRDVAAGEILRSDDLTWKRPAFGISPQFLGEVVGRKARVALAADAILYWNQLE
ncbi:N-acetylneuraminate synthase family protein [Neolewinella lacunae]|uniref:N-acetylneuraminate synthase family protein n=1 Tax=Neolewinella lacunae TaxID=1517758 RepID=A0A923PP56_9BACT|nr:N-acetylneuraminate synthase family protein [Neolewinella lacunae]MBC6994117.1 N-acetylneuraminate synthase family protein [Neolewinella lacunae]MDN3636734.1 N-acetylneuraminate synthase family protein [Neolewinella lacunae]